MYNFLFDKKTLILLLAGLGLAGALLFFAGLLVGVQVGLPPASGAVAVRAPQRREPPAKPAPASMPADCVCPPAAETVVVARMEPCPEPATEEPRAVEPVPVPVEEPAVVASLPVPEPAVEVEPEPVEETVAEEIQPAAFSIQVGAFRSPENSAKALEELRNRGYEPYVVELPGSHNRVLHTVRVGRYANRDEALRAAADFRRREGMAAVVERVGS
jgi:cell division septation protein DedD